MAPVVDRLAAEFSGRVGVSNINGDQQPDLLKKLGVKAYPTFVFLDSSGKEVERQVGGIDEQTLRGKLERLASGGK